MLTANSMAILVTLVLLYNFQVDKLKGELGIKTTFIKHVTHYTKIIDGYIDTQYPTSLWCFKTM